MDSLLSFRDHAILRLNEFENVLVDTRTWAQRLDAQKESKEAIVQRMQTIYEVKIIARQLLLSHNKLLPPARENVS